VVFDGGVERMARDFERYATTVVAFVSLARLNALERRWRPGGNTLVQARFGSPHPVRHRALVTVSPDQKLTPWLIRRIQSRARNTIDLDGHE
jgi:hypothetical protein